MQNKIQKDKWYSLSQLTKMVAFPWITSYNSYNLAMFQDMNEANLLQAEIRGEKTGKSIRIKGENVIAYVKNYKKLKHL